MSRLKITVFVAIIVLGMAIFYLEYKFELGSKLSNHLRVTHKLNTVSIRYLPQKDKDLLGAKLWKLVLNLQELQRTLSLSTHQYHTLEYQVKIVNNMLRTMEVKTVEVTRKKTPNARTSQAPRKQEVCPEKFVGDDLGYGAPYYRLGFGSVKCKEFVPMDQLITLLMYTPKEFPKPAMSYLEMMQGVEKYYPDTQVILATSKPLPEVTASAVSKLNIKFKNHVTGNTNQGRIWSKLLAQVSTPYVLIAPRITHFDDDIDLYRLVRMLSYNDDVAVVGGSYRNLTAQWDLGCRQVSFNYWTAKYSSGYYRSFNECVVCDYLPGPFVAKTQLLKRIIFDSSLSKGVFHDLFWRLKRGNDAYNMVVVCADVMFNIDTPTTTDADYAAFANKHDIKKMINPDGTVRWYGCKRGLPYTKGRSCSWPDGIGNPPCDLDNLGDVIKFTMRTCEEGKVICEYASGTVLGALKFGSVIPWGKDADIHFHTKNFTAFGKLRGKFEAAGFNFTADPSGLGTFKIRTTKWALLLHGRRSLEAGDMLREHRLPTRVPISGAWVTAPRNPGLFARRNYVRGYFRHAEHRGGDSFFKASGFDQCPEPGHSACLDQYPSDGNMQFLDYVP